MPENVRLYLYDKDKFTAYGQQVLSDCKAIVDKAAQQEPKKNVPVVEEKEENENTGLDVFTKTANSTNSVSSISVTSNAASDIYDDMTGLRAQLDSDSSNPISDNKLDEVEDAVKYLSEQEDDTTNETMMSLHKNYQAKYGDKYVHGSFTSDNKHQYEFGSKGSDFSTNNNINGVFGTKKSATLFSATFEYSRDHDDVVQATGDDADETSPETAATRISSRRNPLTRSDSDTDYPDPEVSEEPLQPEQYSNNRSIDVTLLHNRSININKRDYVVGIGGEYHNHGNGQNSQLTFRGGFADAASGLGLTVTTTQYQSFDDDGNKHFLRDTKVKAIILDNTIDEYPSEEAQSSDSQSIEDLPIVKTKNKLGIDLVTENDNLGANLSYVVSDVASLENNKYQRSQFYVKAGYLNEPQGVDTPDNHKIKVGATYNYQSAKANGDYFNVNANAVYHNTMQSGSQPDYLVGVSGDVSAKIGQSQFSVQTSDVKTRNTKFLTFTANYKYSKNNWEVGIGAGYCNVDMFDTQSSFIAENLSIAYKF